MSDLDHIFAVHLVSSHSPPLLNSFVDFSVFFKKKQQTLFLLCCRERGATAEQPAAARALASQQRGACLASCSPQSNSPSIHRDLQTSGTR